MKFTLCVGLYIWTQFSDYLNIPIIFYWYSGQVLVPYALVATSKVLLEGSNCSTLRVPLHSNTVPVDMLLQPSWIHLSPTLGSCPTQYLVRRLGPHYSPSALLEAHCPCKGAPCSNEGHQCVPLSRQVNKLFQLNVFSIDIFLTQTI